MGVRTGRDTGVRLRIALRSLSVALEGNTGESDKKDRSPVFRLRRGIDFGCSVKSLGLLASISFPQRRESSR